MKARNGFVSNSSSSSFVVAFPHKPKDVSDLMSMMFPGKDQYDHVTYYDNVMHVVEVASRVFSDCPKKSLKMDEIAKTLEMLSFNISDGSNVFYLGGEPDNLNKYATKEELDKLVDLKSKDRMAWKPIYVLKEGPEKEEKSKIARDVSQKYWEFQEELTKICAQRRAKEFMSNNKKKFIASFSYSDNDGQTVLEHGDIFSNLNHVNINCH